MKIFAHYVYTVKGQINFNIAWKRLDVLIVDSIYVLIRLILQNIVNIVIMREFSLSRYVYGNNVPRQILTKNILSYWKL